MSAWKRSLPAAFAMLCAAVLLGCDPAWVFMWQESAIPARALPQLKTDYDACVASSGINDKVADKLKECMANRGWQFVPGAYEP
jgi:hypothetical protein